MTITIPPSALEAAARHIAEGRLPEYAWIDLDAEMKQFYCEEAYGAIQAALAAWPGMRLGKYRDVAGPNDRIILPLPQETSDDLEPRLGEQGA